MQHKVAIYPCCALDIEEPLKLLKDIADEIIFCDTNKSLSHDWNIVVSKLPKEQSPRPSFNCNDILQVLEDIDKIDVLFYRNDSPGEGGSGLYILGKKILPLILSRFPPKGGIIITDGSNSGSKVFRRIIRPRGYILKSKWDLRPSKDQPFLDEHNLYKIDVSLIED